LPHLGFNYFFKKGQEITKINAKSGKNLYEMYKFVNFCNLMKKKKEMLNYVKKLSLCQTHMKFAVSMTSSKMRDITIAISKFPHRVKKKLLKVSTPQSKN